MLIRRWFYWLFLATGLLCGLGVLSVGVVLAVRLSMLPRPAATGTKTSHGEHEAMAANRGNPRERFAPEPFAPQPAEVAKHELPRALPAPPTKSKRSEDQEQTDDNASAQPRRQPPLDPSSPRLALAPRKLTTIERTSGSFFGPLPADPLARPQLVEIVVPDIPGANAIWGATGRDDRGRIWYGVSCEHSDPPSAHLMELEPETCQSVDRGDVVSELKRLGLARPDDQQTKIHSKIVQAADGHLYFSSMDEAGELPLEGKPPTFGSHLWRLRLTDYRWEHLAAVPEGLVAVGTGGPYVYALGYFGHVLYQYDTRTEVLRKVQVGSAEGHVSRNFLVDGRGHAYVPRLVAPQPGAAQPAGAAAGPQWLATLVEYDTQLNELRQTPLPYYLDTRLPPEQSHGIISLSLQADGSLEFITHVGHLYRVVPPAGDGPAEVQSQGWMHPEGACYAATLFSYEGQRWLLSAGERNGQNDWLVRDLTTGESLARNLVFVDLNQPRRRYIGLYGSAARDFQGRFYVAGRFVQADGSNRPLLMRIEAK